MAAPFEKFKIRTTYSIFFGSFVVKVWPHANAAKPRNRAVGISADDAKAIDDSQRQFIEDAINSVDYARYRTTLLSVFSPTPCAIGR